MNAFSESSIEAFRLAINLILTGSLIACTLALAFRFAPNLHPRVRYFIAVAAFFAAVVFPVFSTFQIFTTNESFALVVKNSEVETVVERGDDFPVQAALYQNAPTETAFPDEISAKRLVYLAISPLASNVFLLLWLPAATLWRMLDEVPAAYALEEQFVKDNFERDTAKIFNYLSENDPFNNLFNEAVTNLVAEQGAGEFVKIFNRTKAINPQSALVQEDFINSLGYRLLGRNKPKEAIEIFKFNIEAYPKSGNTYDSLAETYLATGEKKLAIEFYKKALLVEPNYPNAKAAAEILKKLEADSKTDSPN